MNLRHSTTCFVFAASPTATLVDASLTALPQALPAVVSLFRALVNAAFEVLRLALAILGLLGPKGFGSKQISKPCVLLCLVSTIFWPRSILALKTLPPACRKPVWGEAQDA